MRIISGSARGAKLNTLETDETRPTLDRVKEALFSIIQHNIPEAKVLDLFAGSGALALEALSRGANNAILCDNSRKAANIIQQNIDKTKFNKNTELWVLDYKKALEKCREQELKFDLIFLDPPYKSDYIKNALELIWKYDLLQDNGIIIVETNDEIDINAYDTRRYGRVKLMFIRKEH